MKRFRTLAELYPPSKPCACEICTGFCKRPGWWTVAEAAVVLNAGYGSRMMLEMSPDRSFGVLSPAFKGCEVSFALDHFSQRGCTFLGENNHCEIHGSGFQPLECHFCHHSRPGQGVQCHADIGKDWDSIAGRGLVVKWSKLTGFWERVNILRLEKLGK